MRWPATIGILLAAGVCRAADEVPIRLAWPPSDAEYSVTFVRSISAPRDLKIRRGFFAKLARLVAGPSKGSRGLLRPFSIALDGDGRLLITDRAGPGVHILDPVRKKYRRLQGTRKERFRSPIDVDTDARGNIYVTDSDLGKIFVFRRNGKFDRFIGDAGGEGLYKRPTGIAIDRASGRIYLTDTLRHAVEVIDSRGKAVERWGERGEGPGEFNFPTDVALARDRVFVLDAMNFRVQVFDRQGAYITSFGKPINAPGGLFRPKGIAVDEKRELVYVVDAMFEIVQAFTYEGELVMAFGHGGAKPGEFFLPAGICVDPEGRLLVADSYNARVQIFRPRRARAAALVGKR